MGRRAIAVAGDTSKADQVEAFAALVAPRFRVTATDASPAFSNLQVADHSQEIVRAREAGLGARQPETKASQPFGSGNPMVMAVKIRRMPGKPFQTPLPQLESSPEGGRSDPRKSARSGAPTGQGSAPEAQPSALG